MSQLNNPTFGVQLNDQASSSTPNSPYYNLPGTFTPNRKTPNLSYKSRTGKKYNAHHSHSNSDSNSQTHKTSGASNIDSRGLNHTTKTHQVPVPSPRSIHTRSSSSTINDLTSPLLTRSSSRKKTLPTTNYFKMIPPMPNHQPISSETSNKGTEFNLPSLSSGSTKNTSMSLAKSNRLTPPTSTTQKSGTNTCAACNQPITTKSVKALGRRYHTHCFGCADCHTPILSKYFPYETESGEKIALCEEHFYKRKGLICCVCDSFLKGTHYTVFGRKYDAEHFCCKICSKQFETDEDFFNHEGSIYCHYHFSKYFIERCEGCEFAILKQYVEIFRGGKNQKWHVECYMIHKCWNVAIAPNTIGIASFPKVEPTADNIKNLPDINPNPDELLAMESRASEKISDIWNTLFKFEEDTATCISDMLLFATSHDQQKGLEAAAKLVFRTDALFKAIDSLHRLGIDANSPDSGTVQNLMINDNKTNFHTLKKEPRNLSAKIMIYLAVLRKISKGSTNAADSQDLLLSVVTGLAHYLKLLIRYGLNNSLEYNKSSHTTNALDKFLREVRNHEVIPDDPLSSLDIPLEASDLCFHCQKSVESECIQFQEKRWHVDCLQCTNCKKNLSAYCGIADASLNSKTGDVLCAQCAMDDPDAKPGFRAVSKLLQLSYLLKIAIVRSKAVMDYELASSPDLFKNGSSQNPKPKELEQGYLKTLSDIKRLRSTRQNTRITNSTSSANARRSIVIESADDEGGPIKNENMDSRFLSDEFISKQKITVEDEPVGPSLSKKSFNRATNFINNQKVLTLDDIPRIVAAEHARELRPNTYKFHNPHQPEPISRSIRSKSTYHPNSPGVQSQSTAEKSIPETNVKYYSELNDNEQFLISHISAVVLRQILLKEKLGQSIDITKLLDFRKSPTFWDKLRGIGNNEKKSAPLTKVFGSELKDLASKTGVESAQSNGPAKVYIPMIIEDLLSALFQKDMSIEGIFRKNGNLKTLKELTQRIDANPMKVPSLVDENAIQLSALLKKFLREMPTPLLTFKLYDIWISSQKVKDPSLKQCVIQLCYSLLPKAHRDLAEVLLFFFMWVSSFSQLDEQSGSKMDIHNLATVLSPNILYSRPSEVSRPSSGKAVAATYYEAFGENEGENYYLAIEVVDYLIEHNEELSIVPPYIMEIYELCSFEKIDQYSSKDLLSKIEQVLKENPSVLNDIGKPSSKSDQIRTDPSIVEKNTSQQQPLNTSYETS